MPFFCPKIYAKLQAKQQELAKTTIATLFDKDARREVNFSLENDGLLYDFSKNILDAETLLLLEQQSNQIDLRQKIAELCAGKTTNPTEQNSISHIQARNTHQNKQELAKLNSFVSDLHQKKCIGSTGKPIDTIVNLGIGGSQLGVQMTQFALSFFRVTTELNFFFASDYSAVDLHEILQQCNCETCMFLVCSKSFTTPETLSNAHLAKKWLACKLGDNFAMQNHFVAITANFAQARAFGIVEQNIFTIGKGVGGRFSIASSMGLSLVCLIGIANYQQFIAGFQLADKNFLTKPLRENIPVVMAWIGIWYRNFFGLSNYAILPYAAQLAHLPSYLQQLEMESNGKTFNLQGDKIDYDTAPVIFGQRCTDAQHSFFQLLHQGSIKIPIDFIGFAKIPSKLKELTFHHQKLIANLFAQQQILAFGRVAGELHNFQKLEGSKPSSCLLFDELSPQRLGQLIATYEHKVAVQGMLWNICSFDQWGVEYGKQIAKTILPSLTPSAAKKLRGLTRQQEFWYAQGNFEASS